MCEGNGLEVVVTVEDLGTCQSELVQRHQEGQSHL